MIRILSALVTLIIVFFIGHYIGKAGQFDQHDEGLKIAQQQNQKLTQQLAELEESKSQLTDTLAIVKRQIQTDRIAYETLQQSVDSSQLKHQDMLKKFEQQRELLQKMKEKLEL